MADLSQKTTDGRLSFTKYVTDNKNLDSVEFEIEKDESSFLYIRKGNTTVVGDKEYRAGTKLQIIDTKLHTFDGMRFAKVKVSGKIGFIPINRIRKPTGGNGTQYEDEIVNAVNAFIDEAGGVINVLLKGSSKIYSDITRAVKVDTVIKQKAGVRGDPKADIILCKNEKAPLAEGSIYISHKKAGGPEAFQQYGGLSEQAGIEIYNHPLVQKFLKEVAKQIGNSDKLPNPVMGNFSDSDLSNMSIFGPDYSKKFSLQHVHLIGQGLIKFNKKKNGDLYEIDFTDHMSLSGDLSFFTGGYLPVFGATFRAGRGFELDGKRYNGARVAIYPQKLMQTRSGLITLTIK